MRFDAVIFDLDGTLIDSMGVWKKIDVDFLTKRGFEVPPDYFNAIAAMGFRETANYTIGRFCLDESADSLMDDWSEMASYEYGHSVKLKPHARDYIRRLNARGIRLSVATSSPGNLCEAALSNNEIRGYFDVVCTAEDVGRGKEFPDVFLRAAERLGASPASCLVFEDLLPAVRSAKSAGMTAWGVYEESYSYQWDEVMRDADGFLYDFKDAPLPE
jgi:HAD superfamily hydrolase (TIGR01509 family)